MSRERFKKAVIERDEVIKDFSFEAMIDKNNPVRLIDLIVDKIVESNPDKFILKKDNLLGSSSFHPKILLKLYIYGYYNRIASSRRLEAESKRNIEVIWLLKGQSPDHWTINQYRKVNKDQISYLTKEFRKFLLAEGYITLKDVTLDGMKLKANASREMASIKKIDQSLKYIDKRIEEYLLEISRADELEDMREKKTELEIEKDSVEKEVRRLEEEVKSLMEKKRA